MALIIMSCPDGNCAAVQEKIISNSNRLSFICFSFGLKSHSVPLELKAVLSYSGFSCGEPSFSLIHYSVRLKPFDELLYPISAFFC